MSNQLIHQIVENVAAQGPDKIAVKENNAEISYKSLSNSANYLARLLHSLGVEKDVVVGFLGNSSIEAIIAQLAIFKSGGIYLPIDKSLPQKRVTTILTETSCEILILCGDLFEKLKDQILKGNIKINYLLVINGNVTVPWLFNNNLRELLKVEIPASLSTLNLDKNIRPEDPNYIFYTSGSTGNGRPILGCHKSLKHFIDWEIREFGLRDDVRVSHLSKIGFDASLRDIFVSLASGGTLYIPTDEVKSNIVKLMEWIEANNITLMHIVPSIFRLMNKELSPEVRRFEKLKFILMAGEPLYVKDIRRWRNAVGNHVELVNLYGTTETTMAKTFHRIKEVPDDPTQMIHVGRPITNAFIVIINNNKLCRIGEMGEIYIKTLYKSIGYYNNEALTNECFVQNPLNKEPDIIHKTGDLGRYTQDRSVEVIGRKDDQVKINGIRIKLSDIEQCLLGYEGIEEAVVIAHKNKDEQNELAGYYTGGNDDKEALRKYLLENLSENVIPGYLIKMDRFPLSPNGKIDKKALPKLTEMIIPKGKYEKVHAGIESELEEIWKQLLGLATIGRSVSFFEIGGNSLKAIQLISRIYKAYNVLVKINEIFDFSTISALAEHVTRSQKQAYQNIPVIDNQQDFELSHAQKRFWVINQVEHNKSAYNVPGVYKIKGKFNIEIFEKSIKTLVDRHEILRTTFVLSEGEVRQQIHYQLEVEKFVNYKDFRGNRDLKYLISELINKECNTIFDLEKGPLFKVTICQIKEEEFIYIINIHHIISDAWSLKILAKEMTAVYQATINGLDHQFEPLKIHYKDYAHWQNRLIDSLSFQDHKRYWCKQLEGNLPRLNLNINQNRPAIRSYQGKSVNFLISREQKLKLEEMATRYETSLFMISIALLNTVFYKYSGQQDIILGSPIAGREHPDLEDQVGLYINTLLLRNVFKGAESFEKLLLTTKKNMLNAIKHRSYPLDLLIDELNIEEEKGRNAMFDVGVTYFNENITTEKNESEIKDLEMEELDSQFSFVKADMWIKIIEREEDLIFILTYATDLFKSAFIERFMVDMQYLINALPSNISMSLDELIAAANENLMDWEKGEIKKMKLKDLNKLKSFQMKV